MDDTTNFLANCRWAQRALVCALTIVLLPTLSVASTYYVDPNAGSNANAGTTAASPWLNPPGTRTASNSGYWSTTWGAISTANKIKCGDVLLVKGGSTQTSAKGGSWWITPTYYSATCTAGARITIRIASSDEWSGSTGHFTINGSGVTASCDGSWCATDREPALVNVGGVNFTELRGLSATQRIVLTNSSLVGLSVGCPGSPGCSGRINGFRGDWLDVNHAAFNGIAVGNANNWQISNVTASYITSGGLLTGFVNDWPVNGGAYVNATVSDSGCGSAAAPDCTSDNSGAADAFNFSGGENMWCVNCTAHDTGERGASGGVVVDSKMTADWKLHWRNFTTYNNGSTCNVNAHWCSAAGIRPSGNDWYNSAVLRSFIVGLVGWGNKHACDAAYGGAFQEVWHATCYNNGFGGGAEHQLLSEDVGQRWFNSIDSLQGSNTASYQAGTADGQLPQGTFTPVAMSNCYRPAAADSESFGAAFNGWPGVGTYANPPAWISRATNKIGLANCDPKFTALSTSSFAANNFRLQAGSSAIDAGRFFLLANGAGSAQTTMTVKANGGWSDPRDFFIGPTSYLDAVPDTIQIQNATCAAGTPALAAGQAVIASMTATTITLDRPCTWADNAGVHLPWSGSAPDMGAFEFGGPASPTLLSVVPITP
jgi:hypothetical protein